MRIDLENRTVQGLTTFVGMVLLNLLYLVCCLPLVTVGAATSALYEVMLRFVDDERGRPLRDFLGALGRNLVRATGVWLALGLPIAALAFAGRFWVVTGGVVALVATGLAVLGVLYLLAALLHGLALVAVYDEPLGRTLRNALLLPGAEPLRTALLVAIPVVIIGLAVVMPGFEWVALTIGGSLAAYLSALVLRSTYGRYAPLP